MLTQEITIKSSRPSPFQSATLIRQFSPFHRGPKTKTKSLNACTLMIDRSFDYWLVNRIGPLRGYEISWNITITQSSTWSDGSKINKTFTSDGSKTSNPSPWQQSTAWIIMNSDAWTRCSTAMERHLGMVRFQRTFGRRLTRRRRKGSRTLQRGWYEGFCARTKRWQESIKLQLRLVQPLQGCMAACAELDVLDSTFASFMWTACSVTGVPYRNLT